MRITPPRQQLCPASISDQLEGKSWTTRRRLGVIRAEQRLSVDIVGIEERDTEVFNPKHWKVYGKWPPNQGVAIGSGLAVALKLELDDAVIIESDWHSGGQNAQSYAVETIVETGLGSADQRSLWMTQARLSTLRGSKLVSEILINEHHPLTPPTGWVIDTPQEDLRPWLELNQTRRVAFLAFAWLLMLLASVGIFSTTLLQTHLRQKRLGC